VNLKNIIAIALLAMSCGGKAKHKSGSGLEDLVLESRYNAYLEAQHDHDDEHGFIGTDCDSLLFSGLVGALDCGRVSLSAARDPESGQWFRRPLPAGLQCEREISRDMFYGVIAYAQGCGDLDLLKQLRGYGRDHKNGVGAWAMAPDGDGRQLILPDQQAVIAHAIGALGGDASYEADYPRPILNTLTGFNAHLQTLAILEFGKARGAISDADLGFLRAQTSRQPRNPLFQAALYRYSPDAGERDAARDAALSTLLDESLFPADKLPSSGNYCAEWISQRDDEPKDWSPCPEQGRTHSGGDFLFAAAVLMGRF
jgi:hypothetical protein